MRVSRKERIQTNNPSEDKLAGFKTLSSGTGLPVYKNKDEIVEMSESEYITKFNIKTETFKEQACRVLTMLESKGVNIYSEDNTPGMYLKRKGVQTVPNGVKKFFKDKKSKEEEPVNNGTISENLRNFFKSKK